MKQCTMQHESYALLQLALSEAINFTEQSAHMTIPVVVHSICLWMELLRISYSCCHIVNSDVQGPVHITTGMQNIQLQSTLCNP